MAQLTFNRKEMKYIVPADKFEEFSFELRQHMVGDAYGNYRTCNVYYDTDLFNIIRMSMDRPFYKEKLRMRSYGVPQGDTRVFLEVKKKVDRRVYKRRERLLYDEACAFLHRGIYPEEHDSQIMREIRYFMEFHQPKPMLYLAYNRMPFTSPEQKDLRITFDSDLTYRFEDVELHKGDYGKRLFENGEHILEIKLTSAFPLWLTELLVRYEIPRTSFSKYGKIYEKEFGNLHPNTL